MKSLPILVRCPKCKKIFNRGAKVKFVYRCPYNRKYTWNQKDMFGYHNVFIWEFREFFRMVDGFMVKVDYKEIKHRIDLVKKRYKRNKEK